MDINQFVQIVGESLLGLLATYLVFYINKLSAKVKVETEHIKDEKQRKLFQDAIDRVNDLALKTVNATNQVIVFDLKEGIANGVNTREELLSLGKKVALDISTQLTPDVKNMLETQITDIQSYILNVVEDTVRKLKVQ